METWSRLTSLSQRGEQQQFWWRKRVRTNLHDIDPWFPPLQHLVSVPITAARRNWSRNTPQHHGRRWHSVDVKGMRLHDASCGNVGEYCCPRPPLASSGALPLISRPQISVFVVLEKAKLRHVTSGLPPFTLASCRGIGTRSIPQWRCAAEQQPGGGSCHTRFLSRLHCRSDRNAEGS